MMAPQSDEVIVALFLVRRVVNSFSPVRTLTESLSWKPKTTYWVTLRS